MKEKVRIFKSISAITFFTAFRSGLSFQIQILLAYLFGAKRDADAYFLASSIHLLIISIVTGALGIVILPALRDFVVKNEDDNFWKLSSTILMYLVVLLITLSFGLYLLSPIIISFLAGSSFYAKETAIALLKILSLSVFTTGILNFLIIIHYSKESFLVPSFNSILQPLTTIMFMVLFKGLGIKSLAYGFVLGSLLQAVLLLPGFAKRVRFKLKKDWQDYMIIKSLFKKSLVVMASVLVFGLISPVQKILASNLPEGSISSLGFVERIICILVFLPSMALPIVLLPQLAGHFTFADIHKIRNTFSAGIRNALVITLPLLVTLFIFRRPIVHLLLQRGAFDEQATVTSAAVLACYLGAFLESERLIILYTLYAMRDVISPLFTGALSLIFFTLVALPLSKAFDSRGLALAYSVTILFYILTNLFVLKVKLKYIGIKNILSSASKIAVASIGSGALMWLAYKMLSHYIYVNSFGIELFKLLVAVGGGAVLYIKLCYVMNLNEAIQFQKILTFMKQQLLFKLGPLKDDN